MTTTTQAEPTTPSRTRSLRRTTGLLFIIAGISFFLYGPLHPGDSGGAKVDALADMLENPMWLPAHLVGLTSYVCFAAASLVYRRGAALSPGTSRIMGAVSAVLVVGALAMVVHALAFLAAESVRAGGEDAFWFQLMTWNESIVNAAWALGMAAFVTAGGLTRTLGNRIILPIGLVGALVYALALATVPFIDTFDALFPLAGLLAVWAVIVGLMLITRPDLRHTV